MFWVISRVHFAEKVVDTDNFHLQSLNIVHLEILAHD